VKGNDFVVWVLRSPLHRLVGNSMLLTLAGRKTGKRITLPVNYRRRGARLWVLTSRSRNWWRNIRTGTPVKVLLNGREFSGTADLVLEQAAVAAELTAYMQQMPASARALGVHLTNGIPDPEAASRLARERLFVKVCLD
jgi:hypothetical protein